MSADYNTPKKRSSSTVNCMLEPNQPVTGKIIVGASALSGQVLPDPNSYRWLLNYKPAQMLDRSMFVYDIKEVPKPSEQ